jgi:hypothetical protein
MKGADVIGIAAAVAAGYYIGNDATKFQQWYDYAIVGVLLAIAWYFAIALS